MGSSKEATVGYRYYLGLHFGLCHGPVDAVHKIVVGERTAWVGSQTVSGSVGVVSSELFGGDKREGGVFGILDIMMGEPTQMENPYLQTQLGPAIPAFRGILSAVWQGGQVAANNPYLKPWAFLVSRIHKASGGATQWYDAKAAIPNGAYAYNIPAAQLVAYTDSFEYKILDSSDTSNHSGDTDGWLIGNGGFGSGAAFHNFISNTAWPINTKIWIRKVVQVIQGSSLTIVTRFDNDMDFYIDGVHQGKFVGVDVGWTKTFNVTAISSTMTLVMGVLDYGAVTMATMAVSQNAASALIYDMNPAHIIRECLTNSDWGMGYPTGSIDDTSFTSAADKLYTEGFGLSMVWNQQDTIENFVSTVMNHIGGILYVAPATGKFALKLIRDDYVRGTLPQYGPTNLVSASGYQRQAWGETINEITVVYTSAETNSDASVTVQDIANITMQGGVVSQTRSYSGITSNALAQRVALRDLHASSTPIARIELHATRAAWAVFPGDVFRLSWPDYGINDVVYRALEVNSGTLQSGEIVITAIEDVFGLPTNTYLVAQPSGWVDPSNEPAAAPFRKVIEAPYWDLVRTLSAADMAYVDPLAGYLETVAVRPSGDATNYSLYEQTGSAAYVEGGNGDFCPSATVVAALTKTTTAITLASAVDLDMVTVGKYAIIDSEYVLVEALNPTALTATIARGVLDTVPVAHSAGARIWFADGYVGFSSTERADGEVVNVRMLPVTGYGELELSLAPVNTLTMDQRQYRPYPPGKVRFDNLEWPATIAPSAGTVISWAHRDRLSQTAYIVKQDDASIGPEASVTYSIEIANEALTVLSLTTGLTGTSTTVVLPVGLLRFRLWAVRGGLASMQVHEHWVTVPAHERVTESGETRLTEDGETRSID